MAESALNQKLLQALASFDPVRVENGVDKGTPDINYKYGWIECKYLERWPVRGGDQAIVKCAHFTPQQRAWITRRARKGGVVLVIVQIGRDYLILDGLFAAAMFGRCTKEVLLQNAEAFFFNGVSNEELLDIIKVFKA